MNQNCYVSIWQDGQHYIVCNDESLEKFAESNRGRSLWNEIAQFDNIPIKTAIEIHNYVSHRKSRDPLTREEISDFLSKPKK